MRHLTVRVPGTEFNLYPVNDVQVGNAGYDAKRFREYGRKFALDPIGRGLGLGDYTDGISPSNRAAIKAATIAGNWYDVGQEMLLEAAQQQANRFIHDASPFAGRTDAWLKGHHFYDYVVQQLDGTGIIRSTDLDIADALGGPYLDDTSDKKQMALITYKLDRGRQCRVLALHGEGSSTTEAAALNRLIKLMASFQADIYITAHHHKLFATKRPLLRSDPNRETHLNHSDALLVAAGSWMRGYVEEEATYAEAGIMAPMAIGAPVINVKAIGNRIELEARI